MPEVFGLLLQHLQHVLLLLLLILVDPLDLWGGQGTHVLIQELAEFDHDLSACGVHLQDVILARLDEEGPELGEDRDQLLRLLLLPGDLVGEGALRVFQEKHQLFVIGLQGLNLVEKRPLPVVNVTGPERREVLYDTIVRRTGPAGGGDKVAMRNGTCGLRRGHLVQQLVLMALSCHQEVAGERLRKVEQMACSRLEGGL